MFVFVHLLVALLSVVLMRVRHRSLWVSLRACRGQQNLPTEVE